MTTARPVVFWEQQKTKFPILSKVGSDPDQQNLKFAEPYFPPSTSRPGAFFK